MRLSSPYGKHKFCYGKHYCPLPHTLLVAIGFVQGSAGDINCYYTNLIYDGDGTSMKLSALLFLLASIFGKYSGVFVLLMEALTKLLFFGGV